MNPKCGKAPNSSFTNYMVLCQNTLKKIPHLKIGGYASTGFYHTLALKNNWESNSSKKYFYDFSFEFMEYIGKNNCQLDFSRGIAMTM